MSLTAQVKDELLLVEHPSQATRFAEAAAMIRFAGEVAQTPRGLSLCAEFSEMRVAQRLAASLRELCDVDVRVQTLSPDPSRRDATYTVSVVDGTKDVIRRLKLVTVSGHPVVGLPRHIISGSIAEVEAAWRGAFLARGVLTEPGRSSSLEVLSPCQEAALALVGLARRLSVAAKTKETRGVERVFLRDGDAIAVLLSRMGAQRTRVSWDEKSKKKQMTAKSGRFSRSSASSCSSRPSSRAYAARPCG